MTYPPHGLLRFSGRWFASEQWSCSLRIITDDNNATLDEWVDQAETFLGDVRPVVAAWFVRAGSRISTLARLDKVSFNAIAPDGKYADPGNPHDYDYTAAAAPTGTQAAATWPQLTTVVSLRTAVARGRGTHGRVYTPTAITANAAGLIPAADCSQMAISFKDLVVAINALPALLMAGNPRVGVVSALGEPGPSRIVTLCQVGDVIDTQRRRRNKLIEAYSLSPIP